MSLMEEYHPLKGKMFQMLKPDGSLQAGMKAPLKDQETLALFQKMVLIRSADQRAMMLQRQGRLGTYAPCWDRRPARSGAHMSLKKGTGSCLPSGNWGLP